MTLVKESVARWMQIAEDRLAGKGLGCYLCLGNDDWDETIPIIEQSSVVTYADGKVVWLDDQHEMASCGYANMTPWHCPRDVTEEELADRIEAVVAQVENLNNCVFNFHAPPYDSNLDLAPALDEDLKPVLIAGQPKIVSVGSMAVREAIERYQPMVGLHGHIHESRGVEIIGRTVCINPGSEYSEGVLRGVLVSFKDGKLLSHQFVAG
jgi:Icc-related predicted phosphoesterase